MWGGLKAFSGSQYFACVVFACTCVKTVLLPALPSLCMGLGEYLKYSTEVLSVLVPGGMVIFTLACCSLVYSGTFPTPIYCWFSHDVTKIQTKKLSILTRFYFYGALQQLETNFHTNFCFKRVLGFVIEYA